MNTTHTTPRYQYIVTATYLIEADNMEEAQYVWEEGAALLDSSTIELDEELPQMNLDSFAVRIL